ncbi:MAG: energy-coupling factor transporter transmembrane protein EcfT [Treponema sp.]|jgi:cobalt/nickel transport system permease protein|nr:energy-coupling factor transporter transmembrane protein EcfT [Treponema sp.]
MYLDRLEFKNDALRAIDPRCRIGAGACLILSAVNVSRPAVLAGLIVGATALMARDAPRVLRRLVPVNLFSLFLWIALPLGVLGERLFAALASGSAARSALVSGGFAPGNAGLEAALKAALLYTLRINAAALVYMALIVPLGIGGLANALLKLRFPAKLVALFLLSYRYIFVMHQRVFAAILSLRLRQPRQGTLGRWRSYTAVFGTALASALLRSRKIGRALQSRGFDGGLPLTRAFALKPRDLLFLGGAALLSACLLVPDGFFGGFFSRGLFRGILPGKIWNF